MAMTTKITWTQVLAVLLFILVVYMILTRIYGHSATDIAIALGLFTLLFVNQYQLNREVGEIKLSLKHSFQRVHEDITMIKRKLKVD